MGEPAVSRPNEAAQRPAIQMPRPVAPAAGPVPRIRVETAQLTAMYGKFTAVKSVSLSFAANRVHALIGPSGCGKSTLLRTLNRMHETVRAGRGSPAGCSSTGRTSTRRA